jgi:hypothetical protein
MKGASLSSRGGEIAENSTKCQEDEKGIFIETMQKRSVIMIAVDIDLAKNVLRYTELTSLSGLRHSLLR